MADEYDISTKELNGILWEFISEGYIEAFIEVRCPQCGAHAGDYKSQEDIPEALICKDCGYKFNPHEKEGSLNLFFEITDIGKPFFREFTKKRGFVKTQREFKTLISPIFGGIRC